MSSNHQLVEIAYCGSTYDGHKVVRWCRQCGAIVVDMDTDGRIAPGYYRKMEIPDISKSSHCNIGRKS